MVEVEDVLTKVSVSYTVILEVSFSPFASVNPEIVFLMAPLTCLARRKVASSSYSKEYGQEPVLRSE